jgi:hypothetical protein
MAFFDGISAIAFFKLFLEVRETQFQTLLAHGSPIFRHTAQLAASIEYIEVRCEPLIAP